jgi:hypothetical protein
MSVFTLRYQEAAGSTPAPDMLFISTVIPRRKIIIFTSKIQSKSPFDEISIISDKLRIKSPMFVLNFGSVRPRAVLDGICYNYIIGIRYWYFQISQPVTAFVVPIISVFVFLI